MLPTLAANPPLVVVAAAGLEPTDEVDHAAEVDQAGAAALGLRGAVQGGYAEAVQPSLTIP
jgi:hypothetical protein